MIYEPRPISTIVKHDTIFMQYNNVISIVAARGKISGKNFHKNPISDTAIRDIVTSTLCFVYISSCHLDICTAYRVEGYFIAITPKLT